MFFVSDPRTDLRLMMNFTLWCGSSRQLKQGTCLWWPFGLSSSRFQPMCLVGSLLSYRIIILPMLWWSSYPNVIDSTAVKKFNALFLASPSSFSVNNKANDEYRFLFWYLKYFPNFRRTFISSGNFVKYWSYISENSLACLCYTVINKLHLVHGSYCI